MDIDKLANELSQMHINYEKLLAQNSDALSANSKIGMLLCLNQQKENIYAINIMEHFGLTPG